MKPTRLLRPGAQFVVAAASRGRTAGAHTGDAATVAAGLRRRGYEIALAYWNDESEYAASVVARYEEALDVVAAVGGRSYLSIKAPAFDCDAGLLQRLLRTAGERGVSLHFDALGPEAADAAFALATDLQSTTGPTGLTLPGRWRRSVADADKLAPLEHPIRVVKGEWEDPEAPDLDPQGGFLRVISRLAGRSAPVRVGTHDPVLAREAVHILRRKGTPCDIEILYGFPVRQALPAMRRLGVPLRVYVPFGHGWLPYCLDHVRARPALLWWLVKDSLAGRYANGFPALDPGAGR